MDGAGHLLAAAPGRTDNHDARVTIDGELHLLANALHDGAFADQSLESKVTSPFAREGLQTTVQFVGRRTARNPRLSWGFDALAIRSQGKVHIL